MKPNATAPEATAGSSLPESSLPKPSLPESSLPESPLPRLSLSDPRLLSEWFAIAWSREVVPAATLARRAMGRDLVLWRSSDQPDGLHCWLDLCVHRGAKLSLGVIQHTSVARDSWKRNCLVCPYHGWRYAASGQCISIPAQPELTPPAKARAQSFPVQERYGVIWICFGNPAAKSPDFDLSGPDLPGPNLPEPDSPDSSTDNQPYFRMMLAGPYRFRALGPRLIENLLDVAHLGIVHAGLLGDPEHSEIEDYEVTMSAPGSGIGPIAKQIRIWQPDPDGTGQSAHVTYSYQVLGPLTVQFVKMHGAQRFGILASVLPIDDEFSEMRMVMAMNYGHEIPEQELIAFQDHVAAQDRAIVESQRPELLPLDLQTELHLRSDRMAIAYRRWLREIGITYGVA